MELASESDSDMEVNEGMGPEELRGLEMHLKTQPYQYDGWIKLIDARAGPPGSALLLLTRSAGVPQSR